MPRVQRMDNVVAGFKDLVELEEEREEEEEEGGEGGATSGERRAHLEGERHD